MSDVLLDELVGDAALDDEQRELLREFVTRRRTPDGTLVYPVSERGAEYAC